MTWISKNTMKKLSKIKSKTRQTSIDTETKLTYILDRRNKTSWQTKTSDEKAKIYIFSGCNITVHLVMNEPWWSKCRKWQKDKCQQVTHARRHIGISKWRDIIKNDRKEQYSWNKYTRGKSQESILKINIRQWQRLLLLLK